MFKIWLSTFKNGENFKEPKQFGKERKRNYKRRIWHVDFKTVLFLKEPFKKLVECNSTETEFHSCSERGNLQEYLHKASSGAFAGALNGSKRLRSAPNDSSLS